MARAWFSSAPEGLLGQLEDGQNDELQLHPLKKYLIARRALNPAVARPMLSGAEQAPHPTHAPSVRCARPRARSASVTAFPVVCPQGPPRPCHIQQHRNIASSGSKTLSCQTLLVLFQSHRPQRRASTFCAVGTAKRRIWRPGTCLCLHTVFC